jgi:hypothetical protein
MTPITVTVSNASGGVKYTRWVRLDSWALPNVAVQLNVTGSVSYTLQTTMDDPNSPTNPVSVNNVTWFNSNDSSVVNASASAQTNFVFLPTFARVQLNSGSGSVTATFAQAGVVPV